LLIHNLWRRTPTIVQDAVRRLRHPDEFPRLLEDCTHFHARTAWLREALASRGEPKNGNVVIHSLHGYIPSFKEESVFAALLVWHGFRPVQIVDDANLATRYTRRLPGLRQVAWNRYNPQPRRAELARARQLMVAMSATRDMLELRIDECAVGRNVLSAFMRRHRIGKIDWPAHKPELVADVAQAIAALRAARDCIADLQPVAVLMNERGYSPYGEFFDAALLAGKRVAQYVASHRDDARVFKAYTPKTRTNHPYALSPQTWQEALRLPADDDWGRAVLERWESYYRDRTWFNFQRLQHRAKLLDERAIAEELRLDLRKKTAVIYPHIFSDATFFYGDSLYEDYVDWFVDSVRCANRNSAVNWILKLHPVNVWRKEVDGRQRQQYAELLALEQAGITLEPHVKVLQPDTPVSSWSLYQASDFCLTVRGTVGFENAALGKSVIVAGSGHYSGLGFTREPASIEEYRDTLLRLPDIPPLDAPGRRNALRFGYAQLLRKPYPMGNYRMRYSAEPGVFHPLNGELEITQTTAEGFFEEPRARRWVEWLTTDTNTDCAAVDEVHSASFAT
jgi:hypothetical protein